jgi:outer membrane protein OmpA-like peptidoglycan-associated protein
MANNDELAIRLDGYSDPRGAAGFNLALSQQRVKSVAEQLKLAGLDPSRISTFSHGATQSQALQGDYDSYALERVVKIELTKKNQASSLAQISLSQ